MLLLALCRFHAATGDRSHPAGLTRSPPGDRTDEGNQGDTQTVHRRRLMAWWEAALACDVDAYSTPLSAPQPRPTRTRAHRFIIIIGLKKRYSYIHYRLVMGKFSRDSKDFQMQVVC